MVNNGRPTIQKLARFGVTGVGATLIHIVIATVCIEFARLTPALANGLAFLVATAFSYVVNTTWSFRTQSTLRNAGRFWLTACLGLLLAVSLSAFAQAQGWHYLIGIGLVVSVVPLISFLVHNFWSFR